MIPAGGLDDCNSSLRLSATSDRTCEIKCDSGYKVKKNDTKNTDGEIGTFFCGDDGGEATTAFQCERLRDEHHKHNEHKKHGDNKHDDHNKHGDNKHDDHKHDEHHGHHHTTALTFLPFLLIVITIQIIMTISLDALGTCCWKPPFTVAMAIVGMIVAGSYFYPLFPPNIYEEYKESVASWMNVSYDVILFMFLPPLLFDAAFNVKFHVFVKCVPNKRPDNASHHLPLRACAILFCLCFR